MKKLPINKNDLDAIRYICKLHDLKFYWIPTCKEGIVELTVKHQNERPLSPEFAFTLGREVEARLELMQSEKRIQEHELAQPNNVITTVQLIDVLP